MRDEIANSDLRQDMNESEININAVFFCSLKSSFKQKKQGNFRVGEKKREALRSQLWEISVVLASSCEQ